MARIRWDRLRELGKVTCVLVLMVGVPAAAAAWIEDRPDSVTWGIRIGGSIAAVLAVGLFLKIHFRPDLAQDYLRDHFGSNYFNRDGFCFALMAENRDGVAHLVAYFQSQYDRPSVGRIALRPARGFWLNRANIEWITFQVECSSAGYGVVSVAFPVPLKYQGARQTFEVGASVAYPQGRGNRVRFGDGVCLRANAEFHDSFGAALAIAATMTGHIHLRDPAKVLIDLPVGVAEELEVVQSP